MTRLQAAYAQVIQGFQGTDRRGSYGHQGFLPFVAQTQQQIPGNHKGLPMHRMFAYQGILDREEGSGPHVEAHRFHINAFSPDAFHNGLRKMQTGRRSGHRAPDMGV